VFNWLFDNRTTAYLLLATAAVILGALWYRTRQRKWVVALGVVAALTVLFGGVDLVLRPKTDREQIQAKVEELAATTKTRDARRLAVFFTPDFQGPGGMSRDSFCEGGAGALRRHAIEEVTVWGFQFGEVSRASRKALVRFHVRATGGGGARYPADCETEFQLDNDNEWRIKGLKVFYPPGTTEEWPLRF
jgi:hypothetical protein